MSSTYYCIWGLCNSQQFCCGDNMCCDDTDLNSLLLTVIIFGIIIVMILGGTCFYCTPRRMYAPFLKKYFKISYTLMSTQQENKASTSMNQGSVIEGCVVQVEKTKTVV
ncbi:unnamed protein product [Xylocopa violacea]|uniref:Uncharacterized protein n=1 Tax=Xylocopa violacea TaxID=135666 RepID=A0ABP1NJJ1_XYLVO